MSELTAVQQEWLAALRSGEYTQAKGCLESRQMRGSFCCLGVACLIAEKHGVPVMKDPDGRLNGETLAVQRPVMEFFGFRFDDGHPKGQFAEMDFPRTLAEFNDEGASFSMIADMVECQPAAYFKQEGE